MPSDDDTVLGYRVVEVPYHLVLNGEYHEAIIDHHSREIRITSLMPVSRRLVAACRASLRLARRMRQARRDAAASDCCHTTRRIVP